MFGHVFGLPPIYRCGLGQFLQQYLLQKFEGQRFENLKLPSAGFITACMYLSMLFFRKCDRPRMLLPMGILLEEY